MITFLKEKEVGGSNIVWKGFHSMRNRKSALGEKQNSMKYQVTIKNHPLQETHIIT